MTIDLTPTAAREIRRWQARNVRPDTYLRLAVKRGGCADWYYVLEIAPQPEAGDRCYESQGIAIAIEESSHSQLAGLKLDYSEDLMGGGFRFQNPNACESCSCSHSFTVTEV